MIIKRLNISVFVIACSIMFSNIAFAQLPKPSHGWNLGNTLESTWGYTAPTQSLINAVAAAGFNTVRIPCAWNYNSTNGTINAAYMTQVTNVVNWCTAKGLYVIINDHWDGGWFENNSFSAYDSTLNAKLQSLWTQVANNFKNYDSHVLFACANEPNANTQAGTQVLFQYYQNWVNTVRATGGNNSTRWLVVQGPSVSIDYSSSWVTMPTDPAKHMMLECHFYDPYQFTQMTSDQSWGAMFYFWGAPYHVTSGPTNRNANWGEESNIDTELAKAQTSFVNKGIPVLMGEFRAEPKPSESDLTGKYITQNYNSCTYWNYYFHNKANAYGLYCAFWDRPGELFDPTTGAIKDQTQINAALGKSYVASVAGLGASSYSSNITNGNHAVVPQNATGARLDANGWSSSNGTKVQIWNGSTETWAFTNKGAGIYQIAEAWSTGACLDVVNSGFSGSNVQIWACSGASNQLWGAISGGGSIYQLEPQCALGTRLDVAGSATGNGTQIDIWTSNGGNNQKWAVN